MSSQNIIKYIQNPRLFKNLPDKPRFDDYGEAYKNKCYIILNKRLDILLISDILTNVNVLHIRKRSVTDEQSY